MAGERQIGPSLPVDLVLKVLIELPLTERWRLRCLSRSFNDLCTTSSHVYRQVEIVRLGARRMPTRVVNTIVRSAASLTISPYRLTSERHVISLFGSASSWPRLTHLDLSLCSAITDASLEALGNATLGRLRTLSLRGVKRFTDGLWLSEVLQSIERLDLSWSGVTTLPGLPNEKTSPFEEAMMDVDLSDDSAIDLDDVRAVQPPWPRLRHLDLRACHRLEMIDLTDFLTTPATFPPQLEKLNLAWLGPLTLDNWALYNIAATGANGEPNSLSVIDLRSCDGVCLRDVAMATSGVTERRRAIGEDLRIVHNALLEEDSIAGYTRFVESVSLARHTV